MTNKKLKIIAISSLSLLVATTALSIVLAVILVNKNNKSPSWHEQSVELIDLKYDVNQDTPSFEWSINISAKVKWYDKTVSYGQLEMMFELTRDRETFIEKSRYMGSVKFTINGFNLEKLYINYDLPIPNSSYKGPYENVVVKNVCFFIVAYN